MTPHQIVHIHGEAENARRIQHMTARRAHANATCEPAEWEGYDHNADRTHGCGWMTHSHAIRLAQVERGGVVAWSVPVSLRMLPGWATCQHSTCVSTRTRHDCAPHTGRRGCNDLRNSMQLRTGAWLRGRGSRTSSIMGPQRSVLDASFSTTLLHHVAIRERQRRAHSTAKPPLTLCVAHSDTDTACRH